MGQESSKPVEPKGLLSKLNHGLQRLERESPLVSDISSVMTYVPSTLSLDPLRKLTASAPNEAKHRGGVVAVDGSHAVQVVRQVEGQLALDMATDCLRRLPKVLPIVPASVDSRVFAYSDMPLLRPDSPVDHSACNRLCRTYLVQLRKRAATTAGQQRQLQFRVQTTEHKALEAMELLGRHERHLLHVNADLREVQTIGKALARVRLQAYRMMEAMECVNRTLPESMRLQEFQWYVLPHAAVVPNKEPNNGDANEDGQCADGWLEKLRQN